MIFFLFFFKQKTAYEMRISDWSSDVCSSDLDADAADAHDQHDVAGTNLGGVDRRSPTGRHTTADEGRDVERDVLVDLDGSPLGEDGVFGEGRDQRALPNVLAILGVAPEEIGRAACRERVCQTV